MKIIDQQADQALVYLGRAVEKDPLSWDKWIVWHAEFPRDNTCKTGHLADMWQHMLHMELRKTDGNAFLCSDGDAIIFSNELDAIQISKLEETVLNMLRPTVFQDVTFHHHELHTHWRRVVNTCKSKQPAPASILAFEGMRHIAGKDDTHELEVDESMAKTLECNAGTRRFRNPPCVLIVEDDQIVRKTASIALKDEYRLVTAENAEEAIAQYMLHAPDIVFLDINLPDSSGFSVLHTLLKRDKDAYVVMFSGHGYTENLADALNQGAHGFVTKPFRKTVLLHYIRQCDALRRQHMG